MPFALAHATGDYALFGAAVHAGRRDSYFEWSATLATVPAPHMRHLQPRDGLHVASEGPCLLHAHGDGRAECMAATVNLDGTVRVFDGRIARSLTRAEAEQAWASATDRSTVVTFGFGARPAEEPHIALLRLRAL